MFTGLISKLLNTESVSVFSVVMILVSISSFTSHQEVFLPLYWPQCFLNSQTNPCLSSGVTHCNYKQFLFFCPDLKELLPGTTNLMTVAYYGKTA